MKEVAISKKMQQRILSCTREQQLQIAHDLNRWKWNDLLGEKPEGFDNLPRWNSKLIHKLTKRRNKHDIVCLIRLFIEKMFSDKELLYYHNVKCNGMTKEEFERFWQEYQGDHRSPRELSEIIGESVSGTNKKKAISMLTALKKANDELDIAELKKKEKFLNIWIKF